MRSDELDYDLPADLIATDPAEPRDSARLMVVRRDRGHALHLHVRDLAERDDLIAAGDLMVLNRSRVLPARFEAVRAATGGRVEGLCLRSSDGGTCEVMLESRGKPRTGERVTLDGGAAELELIEPSGDGRWRAALRGADDMMSLLARIGRPPLPPYIRKRRLALGLAEVTDADRDRYNTVYAVESGSVAAPTAGLHFTDGLLQKLGARGVRRAMVTLHVGLGTFAPLRTRTLADHRMHREWLTVPARTLSAIADTRAAGRRIIPVGTTTVRALESLPQPIPDRDHTAGTDLFIRPADPGEPAFGFRFTDRLMTNFHLPRSTLLAMVAALPGVGIDRLLRWYRQAIAAGYRFYSYGDAMLIV